MGLRLFRRSARDRRHVCVVGLDGVPYGLLRQLADEGVMPRVAHLLSDGHLHRMKVTLPEVSAVSWSSFMTGSDPGTHGIFGFTDLVPHSYQLTFPSYGDLKAPTIWERLGETGRRSVVINQPSTYPARPIEGALVSGFVALDLKRAVWPPDFVRPLEKEGYVIDVDTMKARQDSDYLLRELDRTLVGRERALDLFWSAEDWDYFEVVITGTDRLQHFLWDALEDRSHPRHQACLDYYHKVDLFIGRAYDKLTRKLGREGENFFMLSDHGFTGIKQEVYLSAWLRREGFLSFGMGEPDSLEDISEEARVFALDPGRIYIHRQGRFPRGMVGETEANEILGELERKLPALTHEGEPVIRHIFRADEIYHGPQTAGGPDLVLVSHPGYDLKASVKERNLYARTPLMGMHTWDDAFFWSSEKIKDDLHIDELAPYLLRACGVA